MTVPFMKSGNKLSVLANGKWYQVTSEHPKYEEILEALHGTEDNIAKLMDMEQGVREYFDGSNVEVVGGFVKYDGEVVDTTLTKRILEFMKQGLPFEPLVKFFDNLMANPSYSSRNQLYDFLEHKNLPITEDGCFLAYKAVNSDYKDKWSGKFDNSVGKVVEINRGKVDDDRDRGCSSGLHCGALDYVRDYGSEGSGDHIMIVKVNPADTVSVPSDCQFMKLRTCKYEVVSEVEWNDDLRKPLYSSQGSEYEAPHDDYDDYDDSWDEDFDYEDEEVHIESVCEDDAEETNTLLKKLMGLLRDN